MPRVFFPASLKPVFSLGFVGFLLVLYGSPAHSTLPDLQVSKRVLGPNPVQSGDRVNYVTTLTFTGTESRAFSLVEVIPEPLALSGEVAFVVFSGQTSSRRVSLENRRTESGATETVVRWRGRLEAGETRIQLEVPVLAAVACRSGQDNVPLRSEAVITDLDNGDRGMTVVRDFSVQCPPQATLDDIEVSLTVAFDDGSAGALAEAAERSAIPPVYAEQAVLTATLTNRGALPATVGLIMGLPEVPNLRPTEESRFVPVALAPGQTRTVLTTADLRPFIVHELEKWGQTAGQRLGELSAELHYVMLPNLRAAQTSASPPEGSELRSVLRPIQLRAWDFGDAPDSSSRSLGVGMEAYLGVQASFASVFDTPPSAVPGPAHAFPRLLHLGRSVSLEADADLGARPNLRPLDNRADLDEFDDGSQPSAWQIEHCRSTRIEVQVFISREAQAWFAAEQQTAFLNAWLDFDRNGQWGGVVACAEGRAYEHIVIDHPVDVAALGPGYHRLSVPTGLIHWPAERATDPAWVRLTLSEAPAVKIGSVGNVAFGDGRGTGQAWRFGETEDFLLRPAGAVGSGPELELRLSGTSRRIPSPVDARDATVDRSSRLPFAKVEVTWKMDYANVGDRIAEDLERVFEFPEHLSDLDSQEISFEVLLSARDGRTLYRPLAVDEYRIEGSRVIFNPTSLLPGESGALLVRLRTELQDQRRTAGTGRLAPLEWRVRAEVSVGDNNRFASFSEVSGLGMELLRIAARSPNSPFWVARGTTHSSRLALRGELPLGETALYFDEQGAPVRDRVDNRGFINLWVEVIASSSSGSTVDNSKDGLSLHSWPTGSPPGSGGARTRADERRVEFGDIVRVEVPVGADLRWSLDLADALAIADLPNGHYRLALGDPQACSGRTRLVGDEWDLVGDEWHGPHDWRLVGDEWHGIFPSGSDIGPGAAACALINIDDSLPIDPMSLGFVAVGPDEDGSGVVIAYEDGTARVLGPVTLPDTLGFARGNWSLGLPPSRDGSAYVAVFAGKPGLAPGAARLIDRYGEQQLRYDAQATVVPGIFRSERFFFDEADALFGGRTDGSEQPAREMVLEFALEGERELAFAGRAAVAPRGQIEGLGRPVDAGSSTVELEILVGVPVRGEMRFVPWNGEPFGQPSRVVWDILDEVMTEPPEFDISVPPGVYQLRVQASGHQPYRSPPFFASGPIGRRIALGPEVQRSPTRVVVIDDQGITPAWSELRPGSTLRVINLGSTPRMLVASLDDYIPTPQRTAALGVQGQRLRAEEDLEPEVSTRSGWLLLGEWMDLAGDATGVLDIRDLAAPDLRATVRITEPSDQIFVDRFAPQPEPN